MPTHRELLVMSKNRLTAALASKKTAVSALPGLSRELRSVSRELEELDGATGKPAPAEAPSEPAKPTTETGAIRERSAARRAGTSGIGSTSRRSQRRRSNGVHRSG